MPAQWNIDHFGIDPSRPVARLREYVAVVRGALRATASFDHQGDFFEVRGYTPLESIGDRRLPVHLAATRPGMARLAGEIADGVLYNFVHTVEWISSALDPAVTEAERARGAKIERGAMLLCVIDEDERVALERARRSFARHVDIPYFRQIAGASGFDLSEVEALLAKGRRLEAVAAIPDDLLRSMAAVGDAEACRRRVEALVGLVDWVQLLPPRHVSVAETLAGYEAIIDEFGT